MALEDSVSPFTLTVDKPKPVAHVINLSLGGQAVRTIRRRSLQQRCSNWARRWSLLQATPAQVKARLDAPAAGTHVISVGATHIRAAAHSWSVDVLRQRASTRQRPAQSRPRTICSGIRFQPYETVSDGGHAESAGGSSGPTLRLRQQPDGAWPASVSGRIALVKDAGRLRRPSSISLHMAAAIAAQSA